MKIKDRLFLSFATIQKIVVTIVVQVNNPNAFIEKEKQS